VTALAPQGGIIIGGVKSGHPVPGAWVCNVMNQLQEDSQPVNYYRRVFTRADGSGAVAHYIREGTTDEVINGAARRFFDEVRKAAEEMAAPTDAAAGQPKPSRRIDPQALSAAVDEVLAQARAQKDGGLDADQLHDYMVTRAVAWCMVLAGRFGVGNFSHAVVAGPEGVGITVRRQGKAKRTR